MRIANLQNIDNLITAFAHYSAWCILALALHVRKIPRTSKKHKELTSNFGPVSLVDYGARITYNLWEARILYSSSAGPTWNRGCSAWYRGFVGGEPSEVSEHGQSATVMIMISYYLSIFIYFDSIALINIIDHDWLVVWNIFYFPIHWEFHHPN